MPRKAVFRHAYRLLQHHRRHGEAGHPPAGYKPYPGGHFLAYDMATGQFEHFGIAPYGEGIITMNMDTRRGRLCTASRGPRATSVYYDLAAQDDEKPGAYARQGEAGRGPTIGRSAARWPSIRPTARSTSAPAAARSSAIATTEIASSGRRRRPAAKTISGSTIRRRRATWATTGGRSSGIPRKT